MTKVFTERERESSAGRSELAGHVSCRYLADDDAPAKDNLKLNPGVVLWRRKPRLSSYVDDDDKTFHIVCPYSCHLSYLISPTHVITHKPTRWTARKLVLLTFYL